MQLSSANSSYLAEHVGELVVLPVVRTSLAMQVATTFQTDKSDRFSLPIVSTDPAAAWLEEGQDITPADGALDQVASPYYKVGGLTLVSSELADDSSPAVANIVGQGLVRDIARTVDLAFFGDGDPLSPPGLNALTYGAEIDFDADDPYASLTDALNWCEQNGTTVAAWVVAPDLALTIRQARQATDSYVPLVTPDVAKAPGESILGAPLHVSTAVPASTGWAIPANRHFVAVRKSATVESSRDAYFASDQVAVRALTRVAWVCVDATPLCKFVASASS
jgi:HK97 family phage major capsid protein